MMGHPRLPDSSVALVISYTGEVHIVNTLNKLNRKVVDSVRIEQNGSAIVFTRL